jgi:hypothetical protein
LRWFVGWTDQQRRTLVRFSRSCFKYVVCSTLIAVLSHPTGVLSTRQAFKMPSKLIKRYKETAPMCYQRLSNSVAGSAQACVTQLLDGLEAPVPFQGHDSRSSPVRCAIAKSNLYECLRETRRFVARNNDIEQSFSHLPGSTPVSTADIEAMHIAYSRLVETLLVHLAAPVPFQKDRFTSTPVAAPVPALVTVPAPEVPRPVDSEVQSDSSSTRLSKPLSIVWSPS